MRRKRPWTDVYLDLPSEDALAFAKTLEPLMGYEFLLTRASHHAPAGTTEISRDPLVAQFHEWRKRKDTL